MASCWAEYWFLSMVRQARAYPDDAAGRLEADVRSRAPTAFLLGRTVDALLEHIQSRSVDLVVMTTNPRGGVKPMDGSAEGRQIIDPAIELTGTQGVHYTLLWVLASGSSPFAEVLPRRGEAPAQRATVGVDLIAMTTRRKGGLERWLPGSVADKVLRGSTRPMLLFHPSG